MGQRGWRKELGLGVAAPQPPSYKLSLNTPFMHKHSPHWQRDAAAALRDPGKHDNSGVGKKSNRGMKRALCHMWVIFKGWHCGFPRQQAGCEATWVGR